MTRHVSIVEARDLVLGSAAPLLVADTCGLLDVLRAPLRPKSGGVGPALELVELAERSPKAFHLVVPARVAEEWHRRREETRLEVRQHVRETRSAVEARGVACRAVAIKPPAELPRDVERLPDALAEIAGRLSTPQS